MSSALVEADAEKKKVMSHSSSYSGHVGWCSSGQETGAGPPAWPSHAVGEFSGAVVIQDTLSMGWFCLALQINTVLHLLPCLSIFLFWWEEPLPGCHEESLSCLSTKNRSFCCLSSQSIKSVWCFGKLCTPTQSSLWQPDVLFLPAYREENHIRSQHSSAALTFKKILHYSNRAFEKGIEFA